MLPHLHFGLKDKVTPIVISYQFSEQPMTPTVATGRGGSLVTCTWSDMIPSKSSIAHAILGNGQGSKAIINVRSSHKRQHLIITMCLKIPVYLLQPERFVAFTQTVRLEHEILLSGLYGERRFERGVILK